MQLVDLATLTGAARGVLGPELPAAFSPDERLLEALQHKGDDEARIRSGRCRLGQGTRRSWPAKSRTSATSRGARAAVHPGAVSADPGALFSRTVKYFKL